MISAKLFKNSARIKEYFYRNKGTYPHCETALKSQHAQVVAQTNEKLGLSEACNICRKKLNLKTDTYVKS